MIAVTGLSEMIAFLRTAGRITPRTEDSLNDALLLMFEESQQTVPVRTGNLRASGRRQSHAFGDEWIGEITYGGPGLDRMVDYAAAIENRRHFLEDATSQHLSSMLDAMGAQFR